MNFVAIIFVAFLAINSGPSSALTGNVDSQLSKNYTAEELGTCPPNSSISVKVFRNLKGEWLTTFVASNKLRDLSRSMDLHLKKNILECADSSYITISGILKDTEVGNFSEATFGDYRNNTDGGAYVSCKRINELTTIAEDNTNQTMKALQIIEQRMNSFEKTQSNFQKSLTSFQITLTNIEHFMNEMRGILNSTKNLDTEDKESATSKPSPPITRAKAQMTFDFVFIGRRVLLSRDLRTATRMSPTKEGAYGGVVSNSLLEEDELFEIRVDEVMNSPYGLGIGVIKEKKEEIRDEEWIMNRKGTWAIYSNSGSEFGKCRLYKDGSIVTNNEYPLPTHGLPVGTLLGVSRRSNGDIHFYLNGVDKGPAFRNVPRDVYAFVDVAYSVTKISIMNKP